MNLRVREVLIIFTAFPLLCGSLLGCEYARMSDQESLNPYETAMPQMPEGSIPVGGGLEVLKYTRGEGMHNPLPLNQESRERGKDGYSYFCIMCHGPEADGQGTVGQSFYPLPTNLKRPYVQQQSDGTLFYKISLGFKRHPPLASTVSEEDRWAIIYYIRSLTKIRNS